MGKDKFRLCHLLGISEAQEDTVWDTLKEVFWSDEVENTEDFYRKVIEALNPRTKIERIAFLYGALAVRLHDGVLALQEALEELGGEL